MVRLSVNSFLLWEAGLVLYPLFTHCFSNTSFALNSWNLHAILAGPREYKLHFGKLRLRLSQGEGLLIFCHQTLPQVLGKGPWSSDDNCAFSLCSLSLSGSPPEPLAPATSMCCSPAPRMSIYISEGILCPQDTAVLGKPEMTFHEAFNSWLPGFVSHLTHTAILEGGKLS